LRVIFVTIFVVIVDQISKLWVKGFSIPFLNFNHKGMELGQSHDVIGSFFRITFVENPGMAFGFDVNSGVKLWVSLFTLAASIGLAVYLYSVRKKELSLRLSLSFILAGAIGNLIDRLFYGVFFDYSPLCYGRVVDFLDFDFWHFTILGRTYDRWPVFNVADMAVSIGVIILLLFYNKRSNSIKAVGNSVAEDKNTETGIVDPSDEKNSSTES